jgi:5'(3')-deoxyribonucleotidase
MKTILIDVDGVLADCATPVHTAAERIVGRRLPTPDVWYHFSFGPSLGLTKQEDDYLHLTLRKEDNIGWKIDFYDGACEFVAKLGRDFDLAFVTTHWMGMGSWVPARDNLLRNYFPDIAVVYCKEKWRVQGDWLIDDRAETIAENKERGILFSQPWNRKADKTFLRARSYEEVLEIVGMKT